jgi:hypothetical protein
MMVDMSPTSVGRFLVTAVATGWLITSSVTPDNPGVREPNASGGRPTGATAVPPAQFTEKLHQRLRGTATPDRGRNPFNYGTRQSAPRPFTPADSAPAAMPPPVVAPPPPPLFKLSGIAASEKDGVIVLTAIVIDNGVMVFAKTGDRLSNGYSVLNVEEGAITLVDANGVTQTLRLP